MTYAWRLAIALALAGGCGDDTSSDAGGDAGRSGQPGSGTDSGAGGVDAGQSQAGPDAGAEAGARYASDDLWLCRPGADNDRCTGSDDATAIGADSQLGPVQSLAGAARELDCFYVYPTIDLRMEPGRAEDFSNVDDIWEMARQQAGAFSDLCDVYAPLYHQVTIGTYFADNRDDLLEEAYEEIDEAFAYYMAQHNAGRDVVLIGHSQGSHMLRRLLQRRFEGPDNEAQRQQLRLAVLLGPLGDIAVPPGEVVGGTFEDIPLCERAGQRGCVITYNSYPASMPPDASFGLYVGGVEAGLQAACTNPAALGSGDKVMSSGAFLPTTAGSVQTGILPDFASDPGVDTYFTVLRDFYGLQCSQNDAGHGYLAVSVEAEASDQRSDPILYDSEALFVAVIGLHLLDFNLALEDLVERARDVE